MDYFFDKTCTISSTTIINSGGEDTKSYTVVYTAIDCDFFPGISSAGYKGTRQARETEEARYTVVLKGDKTLVRQGQKVVITDSIGINMGSYIIEDIMTYNKINGAVDNITLHVTQRDVG